MIANEVGTCSLCNGPINVGDEISWNRRGDTSRYHVACKSTANRPQIAGNDSLAAILATSLQPYLSIQREEITEELDARIAERISDALANLPKDILTVYIQSGATIGTIDGHKHEHFDFLGIAQRIKRA